MANAQPKHQWVVCRIGIDDVVFVYAQDCSIQADGTLIFMKYWETKGGQRPTVVAAYAPGSWGSCNLVEVPDDG